MLKVVCVHVCMSVRSTLFIISFKNFTLISSHLIASVSRIERSQPSQ